MFLVFIATNYDAPFAVKKLVFNATFRFTILYYCVSSDGDGRLFLYESSKITVVYLK